MQYQVVNGTSYGMNTPKEVIKILDNARTNHKRIRIFYGDLTTGKDWMEEYDTMGTIGRSTGPVKVPILLSTSRSMGGSGILDKNIVKITENRITLYQHPKYHLPDITIRYCSDFYEVLEDGSLRARFSSKEQAENYVEFIKGKRNVK